MSEGEEYEDLLGDLEEEIERAEKEFEEVRNPDASPSVQKKQQKASELMKEIEKQVEFLEEQMDRIKQKD